MSLKAPPKLQKGDKIAVVSLASRLDADRYYAGREVLQKQFGYEIVEGKNILNQHYNYAGTDEERLSDLQHFLNDSSIKAIIAGRGGYGTSRIIDQINWQGFIKNPKWIIGFSDITVAHQKIQSFGYQSIHGPMVVTLNNEELSTASLLTALSGQPISYVERGNKLNRAGEAHGDIIGGNLCLLAHNVGSESDISWENKILFLEDIGEYYYNIDRMMIQLKRAGKLHKLAGLIVGQFSENKENSFTFGKTANEIIQEHVSEYTYTVCYDFPIGHEKENRAIRCGETMTLSVTKEQTVLKSFSQHEL